MIIGSTTITEPPRAQISFLGGGGGGGRRYVSHVHISHQFVQQLLVRQGRGGEIIYINYKVITVYRE